MILLDIPQGVVTFASSLLAAIGVIVVASFGFVLSIHGRVKRLETQIEPLWNGMTQAYGRQAQNFRAPGNPMLQERWESLLEKFGTNQLTLDEGEELREAFLAKQEEVKRDNDVDSLHTLQMCASILNVQLMEKGRKKKKWWPW